MQKYPSFLLIFILSAFSGFAQTGPTLSFDQIEYDFGTIRQGEIVRHEFPFTNTGDGLLRITDVRPTCGCLSTTPQNAGFGTGEGGTIPVTFDSRQFEGEVTKTLVVLSNDLVYPNTLLTLKGTIEADVQMTPRSILFNQVMAGDLFSDTILVSTSILPRLEIEDIETNSEYVRATIDRLDDQRIYLIVSVNGDKMPEDKTAFGTNLAFRVNSPDNPERMAQVTIRIQKPLNISPKGVYFYNSLPGKKREVLVSISHTQGKDFRITGIESDKDYIAAEITEEAQGLKKLLVTLSEKAPEGKFLGIIRITTDIESLPLIVVPYRGNVVGN